MRKTLVSITIIFSVGVLFFGSVILLKTGFAAGSSTNSVKIESNKLVEIETRPGINQKFILIKPANPVASVILFEGGPGKLNLKSFFGKPSVRSKKTTLLIRKREDFAKHGLITTVIDTPSDQQSKKGMDIFFRISDEHAKDIKAVIKYLGKAANVPVWLIGISAASFSVPHVAIRIKEGIDGLVLLSSGTKMRKKWPIFKSHPNGILDMDLHKITIPVLIIAHKEDKCDLTPPSGAPKIKEALVNSPKVEVMYFSGGKRPLSEPCRSHSPHGFYGIEEQVITAIADFIKVNSK